ncbi:class I SAM-dependent methyltransferase [Oleiharenicola lentus]|uniref:class I SAM-dependent methyltransferase n=1 Tax=Oleiharenicola lentus TaxID=2508720 RepID=UPI003F6715CA
MQLDEYRKLAEVEDQMWYFRALNRRCAYWLKRLLPPGAARVLDAGCGTGGLLKDFKKAEPAWQLTGLDFMPLACELARERTGVNVVRGSITEMPFSAGAFDAVTMVDVISQVEESASALKEAARCVRPGGVVLVNVAAYMWLWSYHDDTCETKHRYTRPELVNLFQAAGLTVEFATYVNMLPLPLIVARRKLFPPTNPTSDVQLYPAPIEIGFGALAKMEFAWTRHGWPLPAGTSVFVVGRKSER